MLWLQWWFWFIICVYISRYRLFSRLTRHFDFLCYQNVWIRSDVSDGLVSPCWDLGLWFIVSWWYNWFNNDRLGKSFFLTSQITVWTPTTIWNVCMSYVKRLYCISKIGNTCVAAIKKESMGSLEINAIVFNSSAPSAMA